MDRYKKQRIARKRENAKKADAMMPSLTEKNILKSKLTAYVPLHAKTERIAPPAISTDCAQSAFKAINFPKIK